MKIIKITIRFCIVAFIYLLVSFAPQAKNTNPILPSDINIEKGVLFITSKSGNSLIIYKNSVKVKEVLFDRPATGVVVGVDNIYVTTSHEKGVLHKLSKKDYSVIKSIETGMGAKAPLLSSDNKYIYVCNQFKGDVAKVDATTMEVLARQSVQREPFAAVLSKDGSKLYVNNFLPQQSAVLDIVAADVSVIDTEDMELIKHIKLSNGSNALRDITITDDGKYVLVSHNLGRFQVPTSQLQQGWMNTSAMSLIDPISDTLIGSVLLDEAERGAAGIWGINATAKNIYVSHSGTHEITVIDYPKFVERLKAYKNRENLSIDLRFLYGISQRIEVEGNGPRSMAIDSEKLYVATYFSDHINTFDMASGEFTPALELNKDRIESSQHQGERIFNDASYCFQEWQSCNGCHPGDARTDGMNWDLLNDGVGNSKNCKSMLHAHTMSPCMISGIRANAEVAVRAGFKFIQFSQITEEDAVKVDEYLKSLSPLPSPLLIDGKKSELAVRGREVFVEQQCDACHSGPLYSSLKMYKIGDVEFEKGWDTPTLIEVWRTAPYLFDGRAATLSEVFMVHKHGIKKKISKKDVAALVEYVGSL